MLLAVLRALFGATLRRLLRHTGYHLVPNHNAPQLTFLGIGHQHINTVIDVGANRGQFARQVRELFPNAIIHCFEPLPAAAEALETWAASQSNKVQVHKVALAEKPGRAMMWQHIDHDPSSSLLPATETLNQLFPQTRRSREVEVPVERLDDVLGNDPTVENGGILIKVDVQGLEDRVIAGGQKIFALADVAILEISVRELYEGQPKFAQIVNSLQQFRLDYIGNLDQQHDRLGQPLFFDAVFSREFPFSTKPPIRRRSGA